MEKHVQAREEDYEGHEEDQMEKHLTMKYNVRELRLFTEFEMWVSDFLEEHIPDESKRPLLDAGKMAKLSEDKRVKALKKALDPHITDLIVRDEFIEEYLARFRDLPVEVLQHLQS